LYLTLLPRRRIVWPTMEDDSADDPTSDVIAGVIAGFLPLQPNIVAVLVTDPAILDQGRVFAEAGRHAHPVAPTGSSAVEQVARALRDGTALPSGISAETATRYASEVRDVETLLKGAHPTGKAAEVVAACDCRTLHAGNNPGIVNPPERVATNVADIRLAPDPSSRKDLLFAFEKPNGESIWKYRGQVKTGSARYVADSLVEMANTPGYGQVAYVDARYVNPDGTPRVGGDAFSDGRARRLQTAKVRLRGIPQLRERSQLLIDNVEASKADGLDPVSRKQRQQLHDDHTAAYQPRDVAGRVISGAAMAAATAAVMSLIVQLATEGEVDVRALAGAAGTGAAYGAGGTVADAALYQLATKTLEMAPEAAKEFAKNGVPIGFCVIALAIDLVSEVRGAGRGDVTTTDFVGGFAAKAALDLLPLVFAPLGLPALPLLVVTQVGGRWLIRKARDADRVLTSVIAQDMATADVIAGRVDALGDGASKLRAECAATDAVFASVMSSRPALRLVNGS
jgi:hypothetical protein